MDDEDVAREEAVRARLTLKVTESKSRLKSRIRSSGEHAAKGGGGDGRGPRNLDRGLAPPRRGGLPPPRD
eukprot:6118102-Pyramimonas_sp.AAC.1